MVRVHGIYGSLDPNPERHGDLDALVAGPAQKRVAIHVKTNLYYNNFSHPPRVTWRTVRRRHYG